MIYGTYCVPEKCTLAFIALNLDFPLELLAIDIFLTVNLNIVNEIGGQHVKLYLLVRLFINRIAYLCVERTALAMLVVSQR